MPRRTIFPSLLLCLFASLALLQAQIPPANKDALIPSQNAQEKTGCSTTEASSCAEAAAKILTIVMGSSPMEENLRRLMGVVGGGGARAPVMETTGAVGCG